MIRRVLMDLIREVKKINNVGDNLTFKLSKKNTIYIELTRIENRKKYIIDILEVDKIGVFETVNVFYVDFRNFDKIINLSKELINI